VGVFLPGLAKYEDKADDLAHALHELVTIERLVALNDWKATRHAPPERRVLMGEALLVRYLEADQEPGVSLSSRAITCATHASVVHATVSPSGPSTTCPT
jgi:hypothetical protein